MRAQVLTLALLKQATQIATVVPGELVRRAGSFALLKQVTQMATAVGESPV
jgi:hypothetical protein